MVVERMSGKAIDAGSAFFPEGTPGLRGVVGHCA
jgi:hypothetical protein